MLVYQRVSQTQIRQFVEMERFPILAVNPATGPQQDPPKNR